MKVEELIKRLEELINELGNVEVSIIVEDYDGTETVFQDINEVDISISVDGKDNKEIYIGYFCDK